MLDVTLPDLSRMDANVQEQVRQRYQSMLETIKRPDATNDERGRAYGGVGMLLHAGEYYAAAKPAYLNAQVLMPQEPRWPYFLAHLYKNQGDTASAMAAFSRVLEISPNDVPTLIWLGRGYLDQGEAEKAEPLFERARQLAPQTPAVLVGLGQAALARREYPRAVSTLEEALTLNPSLQSVHSPLAQAYRGLGDMAKAEEHIALWKNTEVLVPDPFRQELDLALESGLSYELRGVRALEQRDFPAAEGFFKKGVAITPGSTGLGRSLRHKLATALYMQGDVRGAMTWFEETIEDGATLGNRRDGRQGALQPWRADGVERSRSGGDQPSVGGRALQPELCRGVSGTGRRAATQRKSRAVADAVQRGAPGQPEVGRRAIRIRHGTGSPWTISRGARLV